MRRTDRKLSKDEIMPILTNEKYGILSSIGENGYPYGVPISYIFVEQKLYFHCAAGVGSKLKNIKNNPKVCFTVVGNTEVIPSKFGTKYESVIVFGMANEVSNETKQVILERMLDKYSCDYKESGLKY